MRSGGAMYLYLVSRDGSFNIWYSIKHHHQCSTHLRYSTLVPFMPAISLFSPWVIRLFYPWAVANEGIAVVALFHKDRREKYINILDMSFKSASHSSLKPQSLESYPNSVSNSIDLPSQSASSSSKHQNAFSLDHFSFFGYACFGAAARW